MSISHYLQVFSVAFAIFIGCIQLLQLENLFYLLLFSGLLNKVATNLSLEYQRTNLYNFKTSQNHPKPWTTSQSHPQSTKITHKPAKITQNHLNYPQPAKTNQNHPLKTSQDFTKIFNTVKGYHKLSSAQKSHYFSVACIWE